MSSLIATNTTRNIANRMILTAREDDPASAVDLLRLVQPGQQAALVMLLARKAAGVEQGAKYSGKPLGQPRKPTKYTDAQRRAAVARYRRVGIDGLTPTELEQYREYQRLSARKQYDARMALARAAKRQR